MYKILRKHFYWFDNFLYLIQVIYSVAYMIDYPVFTKLTPYFMASGRQAIIYIMQEFVRPYSIAILSVQKISSLICNKL